MSRGVPAGAAELTVRDASDIAAVTGGVCLLFSAVNGERAWVRALEEAYAGREVCVVSCNAACRTLPDVPMLIPEINPDHLAVIPAQRRRLGTRRGCIVTKPNCSIQSYVPALTPLLPFGVTAVSVTTCQAVSGAGKRLEDWEDIHDNVIPLIPGEEEKSEGEPLKIWGRVEGGEILPAAQPVISAQCLRVPVSDGHLAAVSVRFRGEPTRADILGAWASCEGDARARGLPSSPARFLIYRNEADRPQTRLDRDRDGGMGITVGRLREDPVAGWKFVCLSHNTLRGAAGGAVLTAELLAREGFL